MESNSPSPRTHAEWNRRVQDLEDLRRRLDSAGLAGLASSEDLFRNLVGVKPSVPASGGDTKVRFKCFRDILEKEIEGAEQMAEYTYYVDGYLL